LALGKQLSDKASNVTIDRPFLRFRDPVLEAEYTETRFQRSLGMIRGACLLGTVLLAGFYAMDPLFVPPEHLNTVRFLRLAVVAPCLLIALVGTYLVSSRRVLVSILAVCIAVVGILWSGLLLLAGPATIHYFYPQVIMTCLFTYFMLGQSFRFALPITLSISLLHILAAWLAFPEMPVDQLLGMAVPILTIWGIASYGAYQAQATSRLLYLRSAELRHEQALRQDADDSRLAWLENMAGFLRHELRNTMIGVSSSLDLLHRKGVATDSQVYVDRARRSIGYMRKLLNDSAEVTSLEVSLQQDQPNPLELSEWLIDQAEVYRQAHHDREFRIDVKDRALVATTEERITQLLDKLVANAIEHAHKQSPIFIRLSREGSDAVLAVADHGESLPADKDTIFSLFASSKAGGSTENLGLGLYIARLIAEAHGGSIRAYDLTDPTGAQFVVRLPIGYFSGRNRAGRGTKS
jgi:signal transduction histidine kinase